MAERTCVDCGADIGIPYHRNTARRCRPCQDAANRRVQGNDGVRRACSAADEECRAGRLRHGMCELHYRRFKSTGTTARWWTPRGAPQPSRRPRVDPLTRFRTDDNGCWNWTGPMFWNGYGHISAATFGTTLAHRAFYEAHKGPVPDGLDLDHLCRNRRCVNPDHLEPVTRSVNIQRGVEARSDGYCKRGHDQRTPGVRWTEPCTGRSYCRICKAIREREGRERRKVQRWQQEPDSHRN